jgi:type IV fimbrial biogenesis protein FimT
MRRVRAFSLVEQSVVLALVAVLAGMATPSFLHLRRQMQLTEATRALHAALYFARAQAASRGLPVVLCQTDTGGRCSAGGSAGVGWRVFAKPGAGLFSTFEPGDQLLVALDLPARLQLFGTRPAITYWPTPRAAATGSFVFCDADARARPRAVIVSQTGRPRVSDVAADGSPLVCPPG